jgi:hypothetical protein
MSALDVALGTARLLSDYWDEIDADFARYYGMDLAAACFGPDHIGVRRLKGLIGSLPHTSALARAMGWAWSDEAEMTAVLVELLHDQAASTRAVVQALSGKKWNGPKEPLRWPRPELRLPAPPTPPRPPAPPLDRHAIRRILLRRE